MVNGYFDSLTAVIDQVAPIKTRLIAIRPEAPWYTIDIDNEKKCRRRYMNVIGDEPKILLIEITT